MRKVYVCFLMIAMIFAMLVQAFAEKGSTVGQDVAVTNAAATEQETVVDPTYRIIKNNIETPTAVLDKLSKGENVPKEVIDRAKKNLDEIGNLLKTLVPEKK